MTSLASLALLATALGCAAPRPSSRPSGPPWTLTFSDSPCVLHGLGDQVTDGNCGDQRRLVVTAAIARDLGARVQALQPEREPTAGGASALLSSGATTTRIEPAQAAGVLRALERHVDQELIRTREARVGGVSAACPAGQVVVEIETCPGDPSNPLADVCGPPTHTCGTPLAKGASCPRDAACASSHCSAAGLCE